MTIRGAASGRVPAVRSSAGGLGVASGRTFCNTPIPPPASPTGESVAVIDSSRLTLTWTDASGGAATGFSVDRSTSATFASGVTTFTLGLVGSFADSGLTNSTQYYYRVFATGLGGPSASGGTVSGTTRGLPTAPTAGSVTVVSYQSLAVTWTDNDTANETSLELDRDVSGAFSSPTTFTLSPGVNAYTDTGLTASTAYFYRVRGRNPVGDGANSAGMTATTTAVGARTLLQFTDWTYQGAFDLPHTTGAGNNAFNFGGLALRYVGGVPHVISKSGAASSQFVYEASIPALKTSSPYNVATAVTTWGDVYHDRLKVWYGGNWVTGPSSGTITYGLCWDDADQRLYFNYGDVYSPGTAVADPSMAFCTLDDPATQASSGYGPFRVGRPKQTPGGVTVVPSWYATAYLGGKRLMAGFGGYYSIINIGSGGLGPCAYAFAPPAAAAYDPTTTSATDPFAPTLTSTTLLTFGNTGTAVGFRDTDYDNRQPTVALSSTTANGRSGNVVSATSTTLVLSCPPSVVANAMAGWRVEVVKAGVRQEKTILTSTANASNTAYANVTLAVDSAWGATPDNTYTFTVYKGGGYGVVKTTPTGSSFTLASLDYRLWGTSAPGAVSQQTGYYNGYTCAVVAGTGSGQTQAVSGYVYSGGVGTFSFGSAWSPALDTTSAIIVDGPRYKGAIQSVTSGTAVLDSFAPPVNGDFSGSSISIKLLTGSAAGEEHSISAYNAATKAATIGAGVNSAGTPVGASWSATPSAGDLYLLRTIGVSNLPAFPLAARGYQGYDDTYFGAGCWIDTGTKHGLFFWPSRGTGHIYYQSSNIQMDSYTHTLQCFDPMQLPPVTGGAQPDAAWEQNVSIPGFTYPLTVGVLGTPNGGLPPVYQGTPQFNIGGMAYDATTGMLYVMVDGQVDQGVEATPRIHVWHVS